MKSSSTTPLQARRGDPRGQVLVLFALMLVVLLLVSALAVDYGGWLVTKRNYQNISDAAALAGAQQLTRPLNTSCPNGNSKNQCAREAAWDTIKTQLGFTLLDPIAQANTTLNPSSTPYTAEGGYTVWVASPPSDAGAAYKGHVSGPGVVYVRVEHAGQNFLSGLAAINRTVTAWSTAGRFPANFAVIGMCSPTSVTANCLAGDANIKLDGNGTNLIVGTGDLGTNRWTKVGGNNSGVALGPDSNAYMQLYDTCWANSSNQCQLWAYNSPNIDYTTSRSAIPLGAPIPNPNYAAPTIDSTTAKWQCYPTSVTPPNVTLAALPGGGPLTAVTDLPIRLASVVLPKPPAQVGAFVATNNDLQGFVKAAVGGAALNGIDISATNGTNTYTGTTSGGGPNAGKYSGGLFSNIASGTYDITATDPTGVYHQTTVTAAAVISAVSSNTTVTATQINMQKNPIIAGTVRDTSNNPIAGATISITGPGGPFSATTIANGTYSVIITTFGTFGAYDVTAAASGFVSQTINSGLLALGTTTTVNFNLVTAPASLTGTITDQTTGLAVPGVTVTLGTGASTTTNSAGLYNFPSTNSGTTTITLSGTPMVGYAYSTPTNPYSVNLSGATTRDFTVWPKGCKDTNAARGDWQCDYPSGNNCPATTNVSGANVTCAFTQANAIRPGTYNDIEVNGCAWIDARGGVTGLNSGQSAGIVHIKGTLSMRNDSYIFGDGVTLVLDQGANIDVANGGGFVLNFGSLHNTPGDITSGCNLSTVFTWEDHNAGYLPCFRTRDDGEDYAYGAWGTQSNAAWSSAQFPVYDDSVMNQGEELGITFFMYGSGLGNNSRMKLATANMGYLFNGVLYGPNDDIQLGGGKDGQSAAGQIVGWTIEYHGGTRILQNWYGNPVDGQPFLIEPVLGE